MTARRFWCVDPCGNFRLPQRPRCIFDLRAYAGSAGIKPL